MKSRNRRWLALLACLAVLGTGILLAVYLLMPRSAINRENSEKIREGMTLEEVETILGGPPRNESTGPLTTDERHDTPEDEQEGCLHVLLWWGSMRKLEYLTWKSNSVVILIRTNPEQRVTAAESLNVRRLAESPLDMLRRWLRF